MALRPRKMKSWQCTLEKRFPSAIKLSRKFLRSGSARIESNDNQPRRIAKNRFWSPPPCLFPSCRPVSPPPLRVYRSPFRLERDDRCSNFVDFEEIRIERPSVAKKETVSSTQGKNLPSFIGSPGSSWLSWPLLPLFQTSEYLSKRARI